MGVLDDSYDRAAATPRRIVLADDDFRTILAAVEEGKSIFHNIRNFITFQACV